MNGAKSPKASRTNVQLWGCTEVSDGMLAFAATAVCYLLQLRNIWFEFFDVYLQDYFILTGESEFTEQASEHDFRRFYEMRIKILKKEASKGLKARQRYEELMEYFNSNIFPLEGADEPNVDEEEAMLLKAISDGEDNKELHASGD